MGEEGRTRATGTGQRQRKGCQRRKTQVHQSLDIEIVQFCNFVFFFAFSLSGSMLCQIKYIEHQVLFYELFTFHLRPLKQMELKRLFEVQKRARVKINVHLKENISIPLLRYKANL